MRVSGDLTLLDRRHLFAPRLIKASPRCPREAQSEIHDDDERQPSESDDGDPTEPPHTRSPRGEALHPAPTTLGRDESHLCEHGHDCAQDEEDEHHLMIAATIPPPAPPTTTTRWLPSVVMTTLPLPITVDDDANALLATNPFALLLGMMLDQQVPMTWAFRSPATLAERLTTDLTPDALAALGADGVEKKFREKPALHRYPGAMGKRAHALAEHIVDEYDGDTEAVWTTAEGAGELYERIRALPGFGEEKSRIFLALLAKRFDRAPEGWQEHAGPFADDKPRSAADVHDDESLQAVRAWKKEQKARGRAKAE